MHTLESTLKILKYIDRIFTWKAKRQTNQLMHKFSKDTGTFNYFGEEIYGKPC
jgi:hypothetical protein